MTAAAVLVISATIALAAPAAADSYVAGGVGRVTWNDQSNLLYAFPDLATCEIGCSYSSIFRYDERTTAAQLMIGHRGARFGAEFGYLHSGEVNISFRLSGHFTHCFGGGSCSGTFNERMSFAMDAAWLRGTAAYAAGPVRLTIKPGLAFARLKAYKSRSAYTLNTNNGAISNNQMWRDTIPTLTAGINYDLGSSGWAVGVEHTRLKFKFKARQISGRVDTDVSTVFTMITLEKGF